MKKSISLIAIAIAVLVLTYCQTTPPAAPPPATDATPTAAQDTTSETVYSPSNPSRLTTSNCLAPPGVHSSTPKDFALTRQADANCFAWQEFISLNWVASTTMRGQPDDSVPPSDFGKANDRRPVVWETYKEVDEVFLPNAQDPGPWNSWRSGDSAKVLGGMISKTDGEPTLDLSEIGQASLGNPWLTAQSGLLTLYERRINEDEYNYIVQNKLYDAAVQQTFVKSPGINLPDGSDNSLAYGRLGAIETKAAWIELPNSADWPRYKTANAMVKYPNQPARKAVVGLVGLHIIHKTILGQQFIWGTFEHRDNAPNSAEVASKTAKGPYTYYNLNCDPATDHYKCTPNADPTKYNNGNNPYDAPIQVVRTTAIPSRPNNDVDGLNNWVWAQIRDQNPQSVFLNYQLVNTLWSNQNTTIAPGSRVPLFANQLSPGPSQEPVSNTTMETYVQQLTCLSCHASAPIASLTPKTVLPIHNPAEAGTAQTAEQDYASDYSFVFDNAGTPSANQGNQ